MGMFDSVYVPCPACTKPVEFQSKAGECSLTIYRLDNAPPEILADLYGQFGERCPDCGHIITVEAPSDKPKDDERVQAGLQVIEECGVRQYQRWRHVKTGRVYEVVCLSLDEETLRPVITYRAEGSPAWTRKLEVFLIRFEQEL